jgi:solute carrier family 25 oxoglutarate transporter 11
MNTLAASYSRYWEPSYLQVTGISLIAGTISSFVTYPLEFLKTVIQFQATGVGFRGRRGNFITNLVQQQGYNPFKIFRQVYQTGAGFSGVLEGFDAHLWGRLSYLFVRNSIYSLIYNQVKPVKPYNDLSYREKALIAGVAGVAGAIVSHPFSVVSIRQILDPQINK